MFGLVREVWQTTNLSVIVGDMGDIIHSIHELEYRVRSKK